MNGLETPSPYSEKNYAGARDKKMVEVDSVVVDSVDHKGFHANKTNGDNFSEIGEFKWNDYKKHIVSLKPGLKGKRKLEDIVAINKITRYYKKYLLEQKNEVTSDPSLVGLTNIIKHQQYLDSEDYSWEDLEDDLPSMLEFLQDGINKQSHFFDFEMLDHSLFQKLFPLQVIIDYLKEVNRSFGQEIYNIVLKFQTCLTEIFLWHHFNADTRFHPRVSTGDINISDPFLRIRIREQNQKDVKFNQKYFNVFFNLKKFAYMLLDLFFPNVTRRYISMGQEMHRLSLLLILQMFELGLFSVHEMQDLVNVLLQKFENLFVLEKESYIEFEKSGKVPEEEVRYLKQYFYDCKHIVAGICIQIAVLLNDQAFMDSYPLFNKNLKMTDAAVRKDAWKKAYFSNSIVGNILNRIMTSYLFRFRERIDANSGDLETLFNQINDFVMLTMDIENDVFFVSSKVVNQSLINFYHEAPLDEDVSKADHLSKALIALLDKIMLEEILDKTSVEQEATECLQNYLDTILGFQEGRKREFFKNLLGFRYLPNILLSLQCALITLEAKKETELLCGKALTETCKDSPINQIFSMNKNAVAHWDIIYKRKKLRAVCLQTGLFAGNFHIFYVHRSRLKKFLKYFRKSIDPKWNTLEDSPDAHNQWFSSLKKEVVEENRFESLDILLRFYVNCRFLYDLINDTDHNYMRKFHNQSIQQVLAPPLFKVFLKIVEDPDFLPRSNEFWGKTQGYKFHPVLQGIASADLNDFLEKKTTHGINESELRCAVFEVAMLTMKLLNKACTGLYPNWLYKNYVEKVARGILNKTEHLIEISGQGLEWRRVLMLFYINFRIFPNNGVLTNRETEFADTQGIETRINQDHLDGTVVSEIIKELELTKDIERLWDTGHQETQKNIIQYYLKGLFPLMGKFFRGLYVVYSKDSYMEQLNTSLLSLKTEFLKILPVLRNKFNIQFSFDKEDLQGLTYELVAGTHSRDSRVANRGEITYNRNHDSEEIAYTTLGSVRDVCEEFLRGIDYSLLIAKNDFYKIKDLMDSKYFRKSPIFISKNNLEPWNKNEKCSSFILKEAHEAIEMVIKEQENLSPGHDHAYSTEYHIYVELMDIYQEMKIFYLSKPVDENIFLKFLQSSPGYANNFITFISRLVERYFGEITKKDAPDEKTAAENMDKTLIIFLQNEVIISIIQFFSKVVADCSSIRDSLYQSLTDKSKPDLVAAGEEMVSLFYFIMCHLQQLVINKTFMDSEYDLIVDRYEQLAEFFKNLCENNCQKFKEFLGTFVPKIKGLPQLNKAGHDLVYDAYMRIDRLMTTSEVWKRKSSTIHMKDQPEAFEAIMKWIRFITECVNGPCPHNQKRIFSHRTDIAVGILKRSIANVDSSIYFLRNQMCDLVDGLLEGGSKEITKHFASNFTFNEIFQIICSSIKRLYIYCWINGDLEAYKKLAGAAHQKYKEKMRAKKEKEKSLQGLLHQEMEFYILKEKKRHSNLQYYPSQGIKGQNEPKNTDIYFDPRIISQQIMDQMVIEDYETIIEMYLRNQNFSNHVILQSVFKLNNFMMQFAESVAGFKICLHNVFGLMVDRFGPRKVPIYILNKLGNYERKKTYEADQNIVLYMFLCKIISEIELLNPSTRKSSVFLFPLVPKSFFITKATKINFLKESNTNAMTMDMILNYECFDIEMKDNLEMFRNYPLLYRLTSDDVFFMIKYVLWAIAFALNLVLIIFYRRDREDSHISLTGRIILYTLASLILLMSLAFMSIWFFARYSQKLKIAAKKIKEINSIQSSRFSRWFDLYIYYTMIEQVYPVYFGFYIFSSLLGIFLHPFFYSLLLLTIVVLSTTLNYVVKAITTHLGQLLLTVVMMILVIYCYAILSAEFFFDKFSSNQPGAVYYNCTQMWDCVLYVFNYGLRSGGGIGEVTIGIDPLDNNSGPYVAKFVFDVAFFMMINVISLNIIFGIIVDTFAELREKSDQQESALASNCMVCMRAKIHLMKEGNDFKKHIKHDHDFWKYLKFLAYLTSKNKEDQTGFEDLVWRNYVAKLVDWIPSVDVSNYE